MMVWLLLLAQAAPSTMPVQGAPPIGPQARSVAPDTDRAIVVVGRRLEETRSALDACLARKCPPMDDMRATLAHADNQFVKGDIAGSRETLMKSIGRNRRFAKTYPIAVAGLFRANGRIAAHLGEGDSYRMSTLDGYSALKAGLPDTDPHVLSGSLELADMFARLGQTDTALSRYRSVVKTAHQSGNLVVEGFARFRIVLLLDAQDRETGLYGTALKTAIGDLASTTEPALQPFRDALQSVTALRAARKGDMSGVDGVVAKYRSLGLRTPLLVYAPTLDMIDAPVSTSANLRSSARDVDGQWVDFSYWIKPDGTVGDIDIVRESPRLQRWWVGPVQKMLGGRRYAALALPATDPGLLRVERFSRTAFWVTGSDSRMPVRAAQSRLESLDLTEPDAKPTTLAEPKS
ncbi:hypothetical protein [Sphingomonas sp. Leaf205]|uniref:hypothetical protein n=1 Tax=Sphingomonas sp. Leaf205 TaxID=2876551 RepID=UPI001E44233F|nr:hypothetical protein [Sphingomonas sp. Leaf205]